jgi:hypothetical protein
LGRPLPPDANPTNEEISELYQGLLGETPQIRQRITSMPRGKTEDRDLMDIIPEITMKELTERITHMKQDKTAGPDWILGKHVSRLIRESVLYFIGNMQPLGGRRGGARARPSFERVSGRGGRPFMGRCQ